MCNFPILWIGIKFLSFSRYRKNDESISFSIHSPTHNQHTLVHSIDAGKFDSTSIDFTRKRISSKNIQEYGPVTKKPFLVQNKNSTLPKQNKNILEFHHIRIYLGWLETSKVVFKEMNQQTFHREHLTHIFYDTNNFSVKTETTYALDIRKIL